MNTSDEFQKGLQEIVPLIFNCTTYGYREVLDCYKRSTDRLLMCLWRWLLVNNHFSIFTYEWAWCVQPLALSDQEIIEMILFPVINESCRVLAERIVVQASDLDISTVLGMGFPPYRFISKLIVE